jgi:uncharacterized membrane protein YecN with MAPEG domain
MGDGDNPHLIARMRAHENFIEYTPFFLILLALIEMAMGSSSWLWGIGIVYIVARICHAFGMDKTKPHPLRMIGILLTFLVLIGLAFYALSIPYLAPASTETVLTPAS